MATRREIAVRLKAEVTDFKKQIGSAAGSLDDLAKKAGGAEKVAQTTLGRMAQSAQLQRAEWDTAGTALLGFGAATVAGLGLAVNAVVDWESAWAGVTKTVDGTDAELAVLEEGLRELARTLPATHEEIAAVAEAAGQLGVQQDAILGFTRTMVDLGETTNLSADEAATAIAQLGNVMGTDLKNDVDNLGSTLVALGNNGASTERDIILMAQRIAGAGAVIGLSEADVMGYANALASVGIEVEAGGTAISRVFMDIASASSTGGEDLAAFAEVAGMSAEDFSKAFSEDPAQAVNTFIQGLGGISDAGGDVFGVLDDLGFADVRVSRALLTMAKSGDLLTDSLALGAQAWEDNTALAIEAGKRYDTTAAKLQIARNNINDAAINIGESLTPLLASAAEAVSGFAETIGSLPPGLLGVATGFTAVAGGAGLVAGGFVTLFPRVMETKAAFDKLQTSNAALASGLGSVAKAAGGIALIMGALEVSKIAAEASTASVSIETLTKDLLELGDGGEVAGDALSELLSNQQAMSWVPWVNEVKTADEAIQEFSDSAREAMGENFWDRFDRVLGGGADMAEFSKQVGQLDQAFAAMAQGGDVEGAAELMERFTTAAVEQGVPLEKLQEMFPEYGAALEMVEASADAAATVTEEKLSPSMQNAADAIGAVTGATAELTEEQAAWFEEVSESDAAFVNLLGGYQAVIDKNREVAEETAASTESADDSWEDYYDGFSVGLGEYLAELEGMVAAQEGWEANMLILSGKVSQGVIDELARLGPEGAPLVADLVNASDEELARLETVYGQRSDAATNEFAANLDAAGPVLAAIMRDHGAEAAAEAASALARGERTLAQVVAQYDLSFDVDANLGPAINTIANWQPSDKRITVWAETAYADAGPTNTMRGVSPFADGGPVSGPGTSTSDSIPARLSNGEYVIKADSVKAYGRSFFDAVNAQRFASGGMVGGGSSVNVGSPEVAVFVQASPDSAWVRSQARVVVGEAARAQMMAGRPA